MERRIEKGRVGGRRWVAVVYRLPAFGLSLDNQTSYKHTNYKLV